MNQFIAMDIGGMFIKQITCCVYNAGGNKREHTWNHGGLSDHHNHVVIVCFFGKSGPRLNIKTVLSTYGDFHVKDKTAVRTSYL